MSLLRICIVFLCIFLYFQDTLQEKQQRCRQTNPKPFRYCLVKKCRSDSDCGANTLCLCDGDCGLTCVANGTRCGNSGASRHVRVRLTDGSKFGSVATFRCKGNYYTLRGSKKRVCRGIGKWDGKVPKCRILCKDPGEITSGNMNGAKKFYRVGSTVRYWCFPNYLMEGTNVVQCNNRGKWNKSPPKCNVPTCSKPKIPDNAYIVARKLKQKYKYNERVRLSCEHGYFVAGSSFTRCLSKGWDNTDLRCIPKSCGDPGTPTNGKREGYVFTFKSKVEFKCNRGFKRNGPEYRQCQSNQKWGDRVPTCEPINCGRLPEPQYGEKIEETSTSFGGEVAFACIKEGYELKGSAQRICGENGKWSGTQTTCEPVECKNPGKPINGGRRPVKDKYVFEDRIDFQCKTNHTLRGVTFIICQKTKSWTGTVPKCLAPCTDPGIPVGGHRHHHSFIHNAVVRFSCNSNWKMEGTHTIKCNDGTWDYKTPKCLEGCPLPEHQNSRQLHWSSRKNLYLNGEEVRFSCYGGYKRVGDQTITCRNGKWSSIPPSCKRWCSNPRRPTNGAFAGMEFFDGKEVIFSCYSGYDLIGSQTLQCLSSGRWNASRPECKQKCRNPHIPSNGATSNPPLTRGQRTKHGTAIRFSCKARYTVSGRQPIRCQDGRWTGGVPVCKAPCTDPGDLQNGKKYGSIFLHGSQVRYTCLGRYILDGSTLMTCNDGQWNKNKPTCKKPCQNRGSPVKGYGRGSDYRHGKRVSYTCQRGTRLVGESSSICNNGHWSSDVPVCLEICPALGELINGKITGKREHLSGDTVAFRCNPNYDLFGSATLYCNRGTWNVTMPRCLGKCQVLRYFGNVKTLPSVVAGEWLHHNNVLVFSCLNKSMELDGKERITCRDSKWSADFPTCKVPCLTDSRSIANGSKNQSRFFVHYQCNDGYTLEGIQNIACIGGEWSSVPPRCFSDCYLGADAKNKRLDSYNHGQEKYINCNAGFRLEGKSTITCNDGNWSDDIPKCIGVCRYLGIPDNGERLENNFDYNSRVRFRCNGEYDIRGPSELHCVDGSWSSKEPVCRARCSDPGTPQHGNRTGNRFNHSMIVTFSCNHGYKLIGTQSIRCLNGRWSGEIATCSDCGSALGMENRNIPDVNIRASSKKGGYYAAKEGRLNGANAWCSGWERDPYLEIDFGKPYRIKALDTQGNARNNKWVESYVLLSNLAGSKFHVYREKNTDRLFRGNRDSRSISRQSINNKLIARGIRISPIRYGGFRVSPACMRVEIYGCDLPLDCIMIGSRVVAKWFNLPGGVHIYYKAYLTSTTNPHGYWRVELENENHSQYLYKLFPKYDDSPFVLDVAPKHEELPVGSRVLAPWSNIYYSGTIRSSLDSSNRYRVRADDGDQAMFTLDQIRLLKVPRFCK